MSDEVRLSTGRRFYANHTILGITWDGQSTYADELHEGYDGSVFDDPFTPEERQEIAEHMIARWREWAAAVPKERER